ncbi:MAG TPA: hypothetical protein VMS98_05105 [Thermoanaerobaculia bacterium]|nr:hypothetical protein [Thermoanaerobaculia bacterium]
MKKALLTLPLLLAATAASASPFGCRETASRRVSENAAGVTRVVVIGRAGSLRIAGQPGATQVTASGTACSSDARFLEQVRLDLRRNGSEVVIEAVIPERVAIFSWTGASLDFEVSLPAHLPLDVRDGSGGLEIRNVGELEVVDGSGEIEIYGVNGNARVKDGSGHLTIEDVSGSVEISDGSGSIEVRNVGRDVHVKVDGSGGIEVSDVRGNFTVDRKGSGGIHYERVGGKVSIPRRD